MTSSDLAKAVAAGDARALPPEKLASWMGAQRWFSSKLRDVAEFNVLDLIVLQRADPVVAIVIAEARFGAGTHELYQVPIAVRPRSDGWETGVICSTDDHVAYDALTDEAADAALVGQFAKETAIERPSGCVRFDWDEAVAAPPERPSMRSVEVEQSNTSVVLDERLVLKVFRRVEPGINPELEMLRFLADHHFANIAALAGSYSYTGELMDATLGVVQRFVPDARDGWELALDSLVTADRSFLERLGELGAVTGRMHAALASDRNDPDFAPEEPAEESVSLLAATIDEEIERVFLDLPADVPALAPIAGRGEDIRDYLNSLSHTVVGGRLIRVHGDLHLGQTVRDPERWVILDFEGEPGRPLVERRRKRSPLRDVAGMLGSIAYAAAAAPLLREASVPEGWDDEAREHFLEGYMADVDPAVLPVGQSAVANLLAIFELERAIYELRYELNNRPDWVGIPVMRITTLVEGKPA